MRKIATLAKISAKVVDWARNLDWKEVAQGTVPLLIAGMLLKLVGVA